MSTRKIPGVKGGRCIRVTTLPPSQGRKSKKSGSLSVVDPQWPARPLAEKLTFNRMPHQHFAWTVVPSILIFYPDQPDWQSYNPIKTGKNVQVYKRGGRKKLPTDVTSTWIIGLFTNIPPRYFFTLPLPFKICCGSFKITPIHAYVVTCWTQPYWQSILYRLWLFCTASGS
jgi:hypothetical protein